MSRAGFTLLETLMYLALLSILIVAGVASAYAILDIGGRGAKGIVIASEGNFLIRKIDWALSGATAITMPNATTPNSNTLTVTSGSAKTFSLVGALMRFNGAADLSSSNVVVSVPSSGTIFTYIPKSSGKPCGIQVTLLVNGVQFTVTRYLRVATLCT